MKKDTILGFFAIIGVVVLCLIVAVVCCFSCYGTDISKVLSLLTSKSESSQSSQNQTENDYFFTLLNNQKAHRVVNCNNVVNSGKHNDILQVSYYDDYENYYYLYYLGRIEDFIIHDYYSFQYTKDREILKDFSVTISNATSEQIKTTYTNTVNKSVNSTVSSSLSSSVGAEFGIADVKLSSSISAACSSTWAQSITESQSESYENISNESNSTVKSFKLDYSKCKDGYYYCYATCADVDVYAAIVYNNKTAQCQYAYYTSVASIIKEKVFVSDKDDFWVINGEFNKVFSNSQLDFSKKPDKYVSNAPTVIEKYTAEENEYKVSKASATKHLLPWADPTTKKKIKIALTADAGDGITTMQKYANSGYNQVKIDISFLYYTSVNAVMRLYVSPLESNEFYYLYKTEKESGEKNYVLHVSMSEFIDKFYSGVIWLNFENENVLYDYTISLIKVNVTYSM